MRLRSLFATLCLFLQLSASAQAGRAIDSLERIAATQHDTTLIKTYNELTWQYRTVDAAKAISYGNKAIGLAKQYHFDKGRAQAYNDLGIIYFDRQAFDTALDYYNQSLTMRERMGDRLGMAKLYNKIGILHQKAGRFDAGMENQHKALAIFEQEKNDIGVSYSLNNIAIINQNMGRYDDALDYHKRSIAIKEKIGDKSGLGQSYVNVGNIYTIKNDYRQGEAYYRKGEVMFRELGEKEFLANALNNLARVHLFTKEYRTGIPEARESYGLRQALGDTKGMVNCLVNLGDIYIATARYDSAEVALDTALSIAKAHESSRPETPGIYQSLSELYAAQKRFPEALEMHKRYAALKDSIYTSDLGQKFAELQTRFETLQKEKQIASQKYEISRGHWLLWGGLATFLMLALLGISYYRRYRLRQRAVLQHEILHQQELATKAVLEAEETERQRIAKDGVGQMMSAAKMNLSAFEADMKFGSPEEKIHLERIIGLVDESCKEVRSVSHNMMPNALLKNSLAAAIREFIHQIDERQLKVQLYTEGLDQRLDSNTETVLYRVIQECVNNVIKHAKASQLDISLIRNAEELTATIEDNGRGFVPAEKEEDEGIGLRNIRSRVGYLKGSIDIDSSPGKGTVIALHIPLKKTTATA